MECNIIQSISESQPHWEYEYTVAHCPSLGCDCCDSEIDGGYDPPHERKLVWWDLRRKYGQSKVVVSGCRSTDDIPYLVCINEVHYLVINTNMTFDVCEFSLYFDPERVVINPFYHGCPESFKENLSAVIDVGYNVGTAHVVAVNIDAAILKDIERFLSENDIYYRVVYGQGDKLISGHSDVHDPSQRCLAGCKFFVVDFDGRVRKCDGSDKDIASLSTLSEQCGISQCPYNEYIKTELVIGR